MPTSLHIVHVVFAGLALTGAAMAQDYPARAVRLIVLGPPGGGAGFGNKSHIETRWGVTFANVAALTRHHGQHKRALFPLTRLLTFSEGSRELRIQCYLHTTDYAAQGWYAPAERVVPLRMPYRS